MIGVEIVPEAIDNARENAERNNIQNAEFICADAGQAAMMLADRGEHPDVLTVDPPRKGLSLEAIEAVAKMQPERVVYVSCDPATLARDCKLFAERGYRTVKAHAYDLFPRTHHVDCKLFAERGYRTVKAHAYDLFPRTHHVETVVLMSKVSK